MLECIRAALGAFDVEIGEFSTQCFLMEAKSCFPFFPENSNYILGSDLAQRARQSTPGASVRHRLPRQVPFLLFLARTHGAVRSLPPHPAQNRDSGIRTGQHVRSPEERDVVVHSCHAWTGFPRSRRVLEFPRPGVPDSLWVQTGRRRR